MEEIKRGKIRKEEIKIAKAEERRGVGAEERREETEQIAQAAQALIAEAEAAGDLAATLHTSPGFCMDLGKQPGILQEIHKAARGLVIDPCFRGSLATVW